MWSHRRRPAPTAEGLRTFDAMDPQTVLSELRTALPHIVTITLDLCWHGGHGHDYPGPALAAAGRLRERHTQGTVSDDEYLSLVFRPADDEVKDIAAVAPFCDLLRGTDARDGIVVEMSGEGERAVVRDPLAGT